MKYPCVPHPGWWIQFVRFGSNPGQSRATIAYFTRDEARKRKHKEGSWPVIDPNSFGTIIASFPEEEIALVWLYDQSRFLWIGTDEVNFVCGSG